MFSSFSNIRNFEFRKPRSNSNFESHELQSGWGFRSSSFSKFEKFENIVIQSIRWFEVFNGFNYSSIQWFQLFNDSVKYSKLNTSNLQLTQYRLTGQKNNATQHTRFVFLLYQWRVLIRDEDKNLVNMLVSYLYNLCNG